MNRHAVGRRPHRIASHAILIVLIALSLYPFLFLLMTSLKSNEQFYHGYFSPAFPLQWGNYAEAWGQIAGYFVNSISITLISVLAGLLLSALAAWAFARYRFFASRSLYAAVLVVLLVPGVLTLIPSFVVLRDLGLMGTHGALYAVYVTESLILGIVILKSFFSALPEELVEAAALDGAGETQVVARIALPLTKPAFLTVAIMNVLMCWNDYIWPLILLPDARLWTVTQGLVSFRDRYAGMAAWGPLFAGFLIASVPLFILFFASMRSFLSGLTSGALKA
jgi:ABC-type glycerol-3-phosphate transport system permease component